ncbi:ATPase 5, plasma membrane-type-like [Hibiscus syriacus]|uniref:ATPase 5, plasma membrane-type-like n=1 Tax=Hibiscus syriacus TaxID=106335 RepID=A0A6A3BN37_HIBSY|nr:ATPase 5, plasma membrane-type-like [Hibiscus syriacus]
MAVTFKLLSTALFLLTCTVGLTLAVNRCPDCGSTAVPYPLSTGPTCGDQNYKIRCDAGSLIFDTLNNSFPITSIDPLNQRIVIQPAGLVPNRCITTDLSFNGVQLNSSLPFNITSSKTIMFLNCTDSILRSPLDCSATGLCQVYVNESSRTTACEAAPICCTFKAGGSATAYAIRARENRWPKPGMEFQ